MISIRRIAFLVAFASAFVLMREGSAQQVVGVSAILNSTNANEVDGWSETDMDYQTAYYYDAAAVGYLFQDQTQMDEEISPSGNPGAGIETRSSVHQGSVYTVYSEHYLIAYYDYYEGEYYNPYQYPDGSEFTSPGGGDPSGTGYDPGGGDLYVTQEDIYLGYTYVQLSTAPPSITSISPSSDIQGSSGTIHVQGQSLQDQLGVLNASFRDGDITVSVTNPGPSQADLSYSVSSTAAIGAHQLVLSNTWGESEPATFTVGYPPAVVTSLSPSVWTAGTNFTLTITGTGFGNQPTVSVSGAGVSSGAAMNTNPNGTQTQVTITVAPDAPNETATVQVQPGYAGNGFICGNCNGGSPVGSNTASVNAVTPAPQIMFNGNNISGQSNVPIFAGQQINLSVPTPSGYQINSQQWSYSDNVSGANAINGGFTNQAQNGPPSASGGGLELANPAPTQNAQTIYWVNPGATGTVTYTYTLNNGQSASASATFMIQGPTGNLLPQAQMQTDGSGVLVVLSNDGNPNLTTANAPGKPSVGITFSSSATLLSSAGSNQKIAWVQLINGIPLQAVNSNGQVQFTDPGANSGLDGTYPYASASAMTTNDTPSHDMVSIWGEFQESFDATMYVMWDPALPSGCTPANTSPLTRPYTQTPSNCTSIPVPLGSVRWKWSGCAINSLTNQQNATQWLRQCGAQELDPAQSAGYPQWTTTVNPGGPQ